MESSAPMIAGPWWRPICTETTAPVSVSSLRSSIASCTAHVLATAPSTASNVHMTASPIVWITLRP